MRDRGAEEQGVRGMDEPLPEFEAAIEGITASVADACGDAVVAFGKYVGREWKMTEVEWRRVYAAPPPTGDYWDGYNAAMDQMEDAAALFVGRRL